MHRKFIEKFLRVRCCCVDRRRFFVFWIFTSSNLPSIQFYRKQSNLLHTHTHTPFVAYGPNSVEIVIICVRIRTINGNRIYQQQYQPLSLPSSKRKRQKKKKKNEAKNWNGFSNARSNVCAAHVIARLCIGRFAVVAGQLLSSLHTHSHTTTAGYTRHTRSPSAHGAFAKRCKSEPGLAWHYTSTVVANATTSTQSNTRERHTE